MRGTGGTHMWDFFRMNYSWPSGPGQTGRPEARGFWPGPSTTRHETKRAVPRHGPVVRGPAFDLRHAVRDYFFYIFIYFFSYFYIFFRF